MGKRYDKFKRVLDKITSIYALSVIFYALMYMSFVLFTSSPRIIAELFYSDMGFRLNENFTFPLNIFAVGLLTTCGGYLGVDLSNSVINKKKKLDLKAILVIALLLLILAETSFLNFRFGTDLGLDDTYNQTFKGCDLPLDTLATTIVTCFSIYGPGSAFVLGKNKKGEENEETN